jgi:SAM-dependent methyltransferase
MAGKYGDAAGYDRYMGGWSAALSPSFLDFAEVADPVDALDIGCGTGNLLAAIRARYPQAALTGVDPSETLLARARERRDLAGVTLAAGGVEALPFADRRFAQTLSMLVLQEFTDRPRALAEMKRVTRAGGVVAACQWDFARMPVIDTLMTAITAVDEEAGMRVHRTSPPVFVDEAELDHWWQIAGFRSVVASRVGVTRRFGSFEELWQPLLAGSTPSTLTLASMAEPDREAVRAIMEDTLAPASGPIDITAEALVVRGRA